MGAHREELQVGGSCLLKTRMRFGSGNTALKMHKAEVLEMLGKSSLRVKVDDGRTLVVRYNEVEPDEEWLAEQDEKERQKRARIERESQPAAPTAITPMKVSMAELLKNAESKRPSDPPPPPAPPVAPSPLPQELRLVSPPAAPAKRSKTQLAPPPPQSIAPANIPNVAASQLDAWLEMGRDVLKPIDTELSAMRTARLQYRSAREELDRQLNENIERTRELMRQRATVMSVLRGVAPETTPEPEPEEELAMAAPHAQSELAELRTTIEVLRRWVSTRQGARWQGAWIKKQVLAILDGRGFDPNDEGAKV